MRCAQPGAWPGPHPRHSSSMPAGQPRRRAAACLATASPPPSVPHNPTFSLAHASSMSLLRSSHCFQIPLQGQPSRKKLRRYPSVEIRQRSAFAFKRMISDFFGQQFAEIGNKHITQWSFISGSRLFPKPKVAKITLQRKGYTLTASWITASQIAAGSFTFGTAAVLPFYTLMVLAPHADLTKKSMESSVPYVVLGVLYAYLLYLSWTPETLKLMFASKYWLPELPGITRMFSSEMTMASAWIHLLAVDLFAARQVFQDGLKNKIETRHSVSLCLLFCPIGIMAHVITKVLTEKANQSIEA